MSFNITTTRDIVKPFQYVEEGTTAATYGVIPSSPTFIAAGINTDIELNPNIVADKIRALGLEDYADSVKTQENYAFSLTSKILNTTISKYGIQAVGGAGTIGASLAFLFSKYIDGTEYYTKITGARPISTTLSVARNTWTLEQNYHCKEILDEVTSHGIGGVPVFVTSVPSGSPLKHQDGASPFVWNSIVYPERSFSATFVRDLSLLEINGDVLVSYSKAAMRNISWNAEVFKKSNVLATEAYDHTKRTLTYKIGSSEVMTFTEAKILGYVEKHSATENTPAIEAISGEARAVNLA